MFGHGQPAGRNSQDVLMGRPIIEKIRRVSSDHQTSCQAAGVCVDGLKTVAVQKSNREEEAVGAETFN